MDAAAAAEIVNGLHLFFTGISPKIGISIYCSLCVAIALSQVFDRHCGCSRLRGKTAYSSPGRSHRDDRKIQVFPRSAASPVRDEKQFKWRRFEI
ncbi:MULTISPECIES: hypothetical protein [unclassified Microcoleus]|uniref:hypothetical protein n=1 Tax=unclassified Microcoleus TaxID=2642155 RepID=UPI002FD45942